jgi:hypothetical protein
VDLSQTLLEWTSSSTSGLHLTIAQLPAVGFMWNAAECKMQTSAFLA